MKNENIAIPPVGRVTPCAPQPETGEAARRGMTRPTCRTGSLRLFSCALAVIFATTLVSAKDTAKKNPKPKIEVCFVLDTTGSMGGWMPPCARFHGARSAAC